VTSAPAAGTLQDARVLSYKDIASASLPSMAAATVDPDGFIPISHKKETTVASVANTVKSRPQPLIGGRNSASVPTVLKMVRTKAIFVSQFSPIVTSDNVEKSLKN
jgi:hypothetical protein